MCVQARHTVPCARAPPHAGDEPPRTLQDLHAQLFSLMQQLQQRQLQLQLGGGMKVAVGRLLLPAEGEGEVEEQPLPYEVEFLPTPKEGQGSSGGGSGESGWGPGVRGRECLAQVQSLLRPLPPTPPPGALAHALEGALRPASPCSPTQHLLRSGNGLDSAGGGGGRVPQAHAAAWAAPAGSSGGASNGLQGGSAGATGSSILGSFVADSFAAGASAGASHVSGGCGGSGWG